MKEGGGSTSGTSSRRHHPRSPLRSRTTSPPQSCRSAAKTFRFVIRAVKGPQPSGRRSLPRSRPLDVPSARLKTRDPVTSIAEISHDAHFTRPRTFTCLPPSNHGCQAGIQESGEDSRTRALGSGSRLESGPPVLQRGFKCPDCHQLAIIPDPGCPIVATSERRAQETGWSTMFSWAGRSMPWPGRNSPMPTRKRLPCAIQTRAPSRPRGTRSGARCRLANLVSQGLGDEKSGDARRSKSVKKCQSPWLSSTKTKTRITKLQEPRILKHRHSN